MNIKISNIIIKNRHEKKITQEQLAEYMGVSKAAVSKWEKEQCYPDITLLPQLAAFFNITVDELLGYTPQLTREDSWKICEKLSTDFSEKPYDEAMANCREIIKEYYSCFPFLYQVAVLFINTVSVLSGEVQQIEMLEEAKELCRRVVSESGDAVLSKDALCIQCLCSVYSDKPEEVFAELGESLNISCLTEDSLISHAFKLVGNNVKAKEISQCGMYAHLMSLISSTVAYIELSENNFISGEQALNRLMELIQLYNIENLNANEVAKAYLAGVNLYCVHGGHEKALDLLEKYADLCVNLFFPYKLKGDDFFTDIEVWLDSDELGSSLIYFTKAIKQNMLKSLNAYPSVEVLHGEKRYKNIVKKLTNFVNKES